MGNKSFQGFDTGQIHKVFVTRFARANIRASTSSYNQNTPVASAGWGVFSSATWVRRDGDV
jgi:hypothetical protein